jgi:hypothetical protein
MAGMNPLAWMVVFVAADPATPSDVFEKRLKPIFDSPNPSSCTQCHLAGVDLKQYFRPTHRETFLSLRDQGLVDLDKPEKSRILALIEMGKGEKGAELIHEETRKKEYEAFAEWIKASAADPALRNAPKLDEDKLAGPARPNEVIRHDRKDRLLESFENTVWAMRFRCMSCHIEGHPENRKKVAEFGERVAWIKKGGAEATLKYLMESKLLDTKEPAKSLLLLKPLGEMKHGGGVKFLVGDEGYKAVRSFLEDYAKVVNDQYESKKDLPARPAVDSFGTDIWIKFANTPPAWGDKLLQVKVFAWDAAKGTWEDLPIASTDRKVWGGGKQFQHTLTLYADRGSARAKAWKTRPTLPEGKYLVKVYVDAADRLASDWTATLGEKDYVGSVELRSAWPSGYGKMTIIEASKVK